MEEFVENAQEVSASNEQENLKPATSAEGVFHMRFARRGYKFDFHYSNFNMALHYDQEAKFWNMAGTMIKYDNGKSYENFRFSYDEKLNIFIMKFPSGTWTLQSHPILTITIPDDKSKFDLIINGRCEADSGNHNNVMENTYLNVVC